MHCRLMGFVVVNSVVVFFCLARRSAVLFSFNSYNLCGPAPTSCSHILCVTRGFIEILTNQTTTIRVGRHWRQKARLKLAIYEHEKATDTRDARSRIKYFSVCDILSQMNCASQVERWIWRARRVNGQERCVSERWRREHGNGEKKFKNWFRKIHNGRLQTYTHKTI